MKQFKLILILIPLFFFSCHDKEDTCRYNFHFSEIDTTLFISYEIDGIKYKNYQSGALGELMGNIEYNESKMLFCYERYIEFEHPYIISSGYQLITRDKLNFWGYAILDKSEPFDNPFLSEVIKSNYNYYSPPSDFVISDTIFMNGIEFEGEIGFSTSNIMSHFDFNIDSINEFYSNNTYFNVISVEQVCGYYNLVKGNFSTKIILSIDPFIVKSVDNGRFSFIAP